MANQRVTKKRRLESLGLSTTETITQRENILLDEIARQAAELRSKSVEIEQYKNSIGPAQSSPSSESSTLQLLLTIYQRNANQHPNAYRFTTDEKLSYLSWMKRGPRLYSYIQQLLPECFPSSRTVLRVAKEMFIQPGLSETILNGIQEVVSRMPAENRFCVLMFDEMSLTKRLIYDDVSGFVIGYEDYGEIERADNVADHSLVFILQGLKERFMMPMTYFFNRGGIKTEKLQELIPRVIRAINKTGLRVVATVCDQAPTNCKALNNLKQASPSIQDCATYFIIDDEPVFIIYDPPHLIKGIRNNFMGNWEGWLKSNPTSSKLQYPGNQLYMDGCIGRWSDVITLYINELEVGDTHLSDSHVFPPSKAKMRVKYAVEALSETTAEKLDKLSAMKLIPPGAQTSQVIAAIDKLFDYMNGQKSASTAADKPWRTLVSKKSDHIAQWALFRKKLKNTVVVHFNDTKTVPPSIKNTIHTLSALQDLWQHLQKLGFEELNLRYLNQDPNENFFCLQRQTTGDSKQLTCVGFQAGYKAGYVRLYSNCMLMRQ